MTYLGLKLQFVVYIEQVLEQRSWLRGTTQNTRTRTNVENFVPNWSYWESNLEPLNLAPIVLTPVVTVVVDYAQQQQQYNSNYCRSKLTSIFLTISGKIGLPENFVAMIGKLHKEYGSIVKLEGLFPSLGDMVILFEPEHFDQVRTQIIESTKVLPKNMFNYRNRCSKSSQRLVSQDCFWPQR